MNQGLIEENFSCVICLQLAINVVQGSCCGVLLCQECYNDNILKNPKCPICSASDFKIHQSKKLRRIISQIMVDCKHQCGSKIQNGTRERHETLCFALKAIYKNPGSFENFVKGLIISWKQMSVENMTNFTNQKLKFIVGLQQIIANNVLKLRQNQKQNDSQYWSLMIKNGDSEDSQILINLSLILFNRKKYKQSLQHCIKALQLILPQQIILDALEFLIHIINCIILQQKDKQNIKQCISILFQFVLRLIIKDQHFCPYLIAMNLLAKLQNLIGNQQALIELLSKLSIDEMAANDICKRIFAQICESVNIFHQMNMENKIQQNQKLELWQDIRYYTKTINLIYQQIGNQAGFYMLVANHTQEIFDTLKQNSQTNLKSKIAQCFVLETIENSLVEIKTPTENIIFQNKTMMSSKFYDFYLALEIKFYFWTNRKFKKMFDQNIEDKINNIVQQLLNNKTQQNMKQYNQTQQKQRVESIIFILKNKFSTIVNLIKKGNRNQQNIKIISKVLENIKVQQKKQIKVTKKRVIKKIKK